MFVMHPTPAGVVFAVDRGRVFGRFCRAVLLVCVMVCVSGCFSAFEDADPDSASHNHPDVRQEEVHWDHFPTQCAEHQKEVSTYTYDPAGVIQEIKHSRMNGDSDTSTFEAGRMLRRTIGRDGEPLAVEADWQYSGDLLTRVDVVDRRGGDEDERVWALVFVHDEAGRVSEVRGEGVLSDALAHNLSDQLNDLRLFGEEMEIADGINLHWPYEVARLILGESAPVSFSVRYAYDAEGRLAKTDWDVDGDNQPDYVSEQVYTALLHTTNNHKTSKPDAPYNVFERTFDEDGALVSIFSVRGGEVVARALWMATDLPEGNPCGAVRQVKHTRDYHGGAGVEETWIKKYDAEGRLIFDATFNNDGEVLGRTFINHLADGRLEERDHDSNGSIDQTTRYTYDAEGRLVSVILEEELQSPAACEPFGLWRVDETCE